MTCNANIPVLTGDEINEKLSRLDGWARAGDFIEKKYSFKNFLRAMMFVNAVAYVAESMNHHPDILVHYNEVTLRNWTHVAGGITELDFALASKIEELEKR